jgi:N-acetylglucosaminyldiphosphoundecaprenol N-acetyl-beta-D-mannosaminyltransferase
MKLETKGLPTNNIHFLSLPFASVEEFKYTEIAEEVNKIRPDLIWVSLGAPKQERFMHYLLPHIDSGVMLGVGAAFNFYIGKLAIPRLGLGRLRLIWLNRLFKEPRKSIQRLFSYLKILPRLYFEEKRIYRKNNG